MAEETKFEKYFVENTRKCLNGSIIINTQVTLPDAYSIISRDYNKIGGSYTNSVGRIDVIFRYKKEVYIGEIKYYDFSSYEFWDALKVVGYCAYYNWMYKTKHKPAVLMPAGKVKLEHQVVASRLKVQIFTIEKIGMTYKVHLLDDRPYWKQNIKKI